MATRKGRPPSCECGECQTCKKREYHRRWYQKLSPERKRAMVAQRNMGKEREADRRRYARSEARRADGRRHGAAWAVRNPAKRRAHARVHRAVATGELRRESCEVCGNEPAHAHHDDYDRPLDVRWLCPLHHSELHAAVAA